MKKQAAIFKHLFTWPLLLLMLACSWDYQISHYRVPQAVQDGNIDNYSIAIDSISGSFGDCLRQKYLRLPDSAHFFSDCDCPNGIEVDSAYGKKHKLIWTRINVRAAKNPNYLYSKYTYRFFDRKGRPIKQTTNIYQPDTNYQYQQYFNEAGELQAEKLPLYDQYEIIDL
ncbi:MAG: hypothetical protein DA405_07740 [Bacteroidetes bacterium]|nr:MAG: hypothetical protein DA405_07740 [Bacteroidota bacterium]